MPTSTATATLLATGISAYTLGLLAIRARLRLGPLQVRAAVTLLSLPTILLGTEVSPLAQLTALGLLLIAAAVIERTQSPRLAVETPNAPGP